MLFPLCLFAYLYDPRTLRTLGTLIKPETACKREMLLIMMLSHVMRVDDVLRKELDWLEAAEGQCYYSDEI